jgi:hypothetical protein
MDETLLAAKPNTVGYPTLTNDEKLSVREAQYVLITTREQAIAAVNAAEKNVNSTVEQLAKKYSLDVNKTTFNLQTLEFAAKP